MQVGSIGRQADTMFTLTLMTAALAACGGGGGGDTSQSSTIAPSNVVAVTTPTAPAFPSTAAFAVSAVETPAPFGTPGTPTAAQVESTAVAPAVAAVSAALVDSIAAVAAPVAAAVSVPAVSTAGAAQAVASAASDVAIANAGADSSALVQDDSETAQALAARAPPREAAAVATVTAASRLAAAISDMTKTHEVVPLGVGTAIGWKYRPVLVANTEPYGSAIPSWWPGIRFAEWRALVPWFVIYEGEPANPAKNVQVEVAGIEAWVYLSSTRKWSQLGAAQKPAWDLLHAPNAIDIASFQANAVATNDSVRYTTGANFMIHGGLQQSPTPWTSSNADIRAVYVSVRHRLVVKDATKADDRERANIGLEVGMDYYPWMGSKPADVGASYLPGAGAGRFLKVGVNWRYSSLLLKKEGVTDAELTTSGLPVFTF